ncbi:MAG: right-handed parallel beta-helix repeat-containing protein [Candidatus Thermoplasmatota archaeon]|nr:right-handed parallel beta-helix repeat-containing protein [Candidatus Thermoplasmatota archaeon]MBU1941893.1 right-handed parallel beta-helix repeat-containing protein [Candidatus Thermoplasmatota archaeon]
MHKKTIGLTILILLFLSTINSAAMITKPQHQDQSESIEYKSIDIATNLPSSFSWRDINGVDFTTPIRNQAPFPSCETFAITAAVETMVQYAVGYPFGCDLSEAHLYFYSGGNTDWGSFPENDTQFLKDYGIPDEACWPYPKKVMQYPLNTTSPDWQNRTVKITNWTYLPEDPEAIKIALVTNGPVPTYFVVYDDFIQYKKGIYRHRWGDLRGIHYVCIVGYNDDPGYWIVKNSWGKKYQDEGWFNIKYGECSIEKKSFYLTGVYGQFPIIYVDDDNTQGPWNGTQEHPYQTIQDGIHHAYEGWTIYVYNGTYNEHVIINKTINLDGENPQTTIIDAEGTGHCVVISAPSVRVSGFTIQNSGTEPFDAGIKTLSLNSNVTIQNNIIQNNTLGIFLNYAYAQSGNIVKDNLIHNNIDGLYIHWANNNQITNNIIIYNHDDGIEFEATQTSHIIGNRIEHNGDYGLFLHSGSHKNTIQRNDFIDNTRHAAFDGSIRNKWSRNHWSGSLRILVKPIRGKLDVYNFPWIDYDFFPALKPHYS